MFIEFYQILNDSVLEIESGKQWIGSWVINQLLYGILSVVTAEHTKRFQELVEPLSYCDGVRVLSHVIVDDGLIIVQPTIFYIIQPINVLCRCVNLRYKE